MSPHVQRGKATMPDTLRGCTIMILLLCAAGCKTATVKSSRDFGSPADTSPDVVYVADFELYASDIRHEDGLLSSRPGPVGRVGNRLSGASSDPAARAREIVDLMAVSLVSDLEKNGFTACRLQPLSRMPSSGWLVRGVLTSVQEGNRLRRAMIGFGQGETDIQVVTVFDDLSQGPLKPFYEVTTDASSGNAPGAAPMLLVSPYGAPVRFVMAGKDLNKNVKQTAAQIAKQVVTRMKPQK